MPASLPLKAAGLISALAISAASALVDPASPPGDRYQVAMRLAAGILMVAGPLLLSHAIGNTFLRQGGNMAFKALYWATMASAGAGLSEASSAFYAVDVPAAASLSAISLSAAGLLLLRFQKGG